MNQKNDRRALFTAAGAGLLLAACRPAVHPEAGEGPGDDVSATEDLMREHGVIRRVLVIYREAAGRLRSEPEGVPANALESAAKLMRSFAEDYHEKMLEEARIFPALAKMGGPLVTTVNTLIAQHQRGREVTDYILAVAQKAFSPPSAVPLARTLESFARMYEEHTAVEDTVIFPAWKKLLTAKELDAMGDRFEDIEHQAFGKDGFDDAAEQVAAIEKIMGIDLGAMTAPSPAP